MSAAARFNLPHFSEGNQARSLSINRRFVPGIEVVRRGRAEPFLDKQPALCSSPAQWPGIALESYAVPALFIPRHEHTNAFLHLVIRGSVKYEGKHERPRLTIYLAAGHNLSSASGNRGGSELGWANSPDCCGH
jgi:hypothetical protein